MLRQMNRISNFEDDGEDEHMNDMISKGALRTNAVHVKLIDSKIHFNAFRG